MAKTIVGSFDTFEHAAGAVDALERMGVPADDLNLVANDAAGNLAAGRGTGTPSAASTRLGADATSEGGADDETVASGAGKGAVAGGVIGGTAGLLAGLAGLALPGIGPLVAAGPIAVMLTGAGIGAFAGGLIGGLRQLGVSDSDAEYYAEAVRRGGALVVVRAEDHRAQSVADLMRDRGAIDIESRVAAWRESGWRRFDETAQPCSRDDIERDRVTDRGTIQGTERVAVGERDLRTGQSTGTPHVAGTTVGTTGVGTVASTTTGIRGTEHPNLGTSPDRPGVDTRTGEHARTGRAGMAGGDHTNPGGSGRSAAQRAGDAIERRIPDDSDGDGR
jgi:hypothetical protein